jgi:hypothetical protein
MQHDRLRIARDTAVRIGRHDGRELRYEIAMRAISKERREDERIDLIGRIRVREHRIDVVGLVGAADTQMPRDRPRMLSARNVSGVDARARGRPREPGDRERKRDERTKRLHRTGDRLSANAGAIAS